MTIIATMLLILEAPRIFSIIRRWWEAAAAAPAPAPEAPQGGAMTGEELAAALEQMQPTRDNLERVAAALRRLRDSLAAE